MFRADGLKIYPTLVIRGTGNFCMYYIMYVVLLICYFVVSKDCMNSGRQADTKVIQPQHWLT